MKISGQAIKDALKVIAVLAIAAAIAVPSLPKAKNDDDFDEEKGWTAEQQEKAWATYNVTKWSDVPGILFDSNGSYAKGNVSKDFRGSWEKTIAKILSEVKMETKFKKSTYKELFLVMAERLHEEGNSMGKSWKMKNKANENDPQAAFNMQDLCFMQRILNMETGPDGEKGSLRLMITRYFSAEKAYFSATRSGKDQSEGVYTYSMFDKDSVELRTIVQATIYGNGYASENASYSEKSAEKYRKAHEDSVFVSYDGFADDVTKNYQTMKSEGHVVEG